MHYPSHNDCMEALRRYIRSGGRPAKLPAQRAPLRYGVPETLSPYESLDNLVDVADVARGPAMQAADALALDMAHLGM